MKLTIETKDKTHAIQMLKADDMANFIFWLNNNAWREFEDSNVDYYVFFNRITKELENRGLDIKEILG